MLRAYINALQGSIILVRLAIPVLFITALEHCLRSANKQYLFSFSDSKITYSKFCAFQLLI